ncbi:MAG: hypothetical protein CL928_11200 [Deltaproteobacteria bacterium]|nr:hypothetical protein [Deltaproteobacteria bacterium]
MGRWWLAVGCWAALCTLVASGSSPVQAAEPAAPTTEDGLGDVPMDTLREAMRSWDALAQAWFRLRAGDAAGARSEVQALLKQRPRDPDALHLLGIVAASEGRWPLAVTSLRRSLRKRPDGWVCAHLVQVLLQRGRRMAAWRMVKLASSRLPPDPRVRRARAYVLVARAQLSDAREELESLEKDEPSAAVAYQLAVVLAELGEDQASISASQRSVERDPENGAYHRQLFESLLRVGDWTGLSAAGSSAGAGEAGPGVAAYYRGIALFKLDDVDGAVRAFAEVAQHGRPDLLALTGSAAYLLQLSDFAGAERAARLALRQLEDDPSLHHLLAMALTRLDRESEGLAYYRRAADGDPLNADFRLDLLASLCSLARLEELDEGLLRAQKDFPEDPRFASRQNVCPAP